jgi:hypothetical protein
LAGWTFITLLTASTAAFCRFASIVVVTTRPPVSIWSCEIPLARSSASARS